MDCITWSQYPLETIDTEAMDGYNILFLNQTGDQMMNDYNSPDTDPMLYHEASEYHDAEAFEDRWNINQYEDDDIPIDER